MRIAYLFYGDAFTLDGVGRKIRGQAARWREAGHEVEVIAVSPAPPDRGARPAFALRAFPFSGIASRAGATARAAGAVRRLRPDLVYLRYDRFVPPVGPLLWPLRIVIEINSDDRKEMVLYGRAAALYNGLHRRVTLPLAAGFVCVGHELAQTCVGGLRKPIAVIGNGAEARGATPAAPARGARPAGVILVGARPVGSWIGIDKLLDLARALPGVDFHLVGLTAPEVGAPLPPTVTAHGMLSREGYAPLLAAADFAVGPLALHRKGLGEASPLKVRECLVFGLPVLMGHEDTDFLDDDPWFLLRLPNREDNVSAGLDAIREWLDRVVGRRVSPDEIRRLGADVKEAARLSFLERLVAAPRRGAVEAPAG